MYFMFSTYLILCMNKYDYHICLLFFMIYGPNVGSTFIILYMAGFLTQWAFYKVQEHLKQSSDKEVITFRSWKSHVVKPSRADLSWPRCTGRAGHWPRCTGCSALAELVTGRGALAKLHCSGKKCHNLGYKVPN